MSITLKSSAGYQIDDRVSIALDALDSKQQGAVGRVLSDREHFLTHTSKRHRVRRISKSQPVYAVSVPPGLDIIYKVSGDAIEVIDLMGSATLKRFGAKKKHRSPKTSKKSGGVGGMI
jgi:hypothetical protein